MRLVFCSLSIRLATLRPPPKCTCLLHFERVVGGRTDSVTLDDRWNQTHVSNCQLFQHISQTFLFTLCMLVLMLAFWMFYHVRHHMFMSIHLPKRDFHWIAFHMMSSNVDTL